MVADILQLSQVVGRDDRRQVPLRHIVGKQAFHRLAHHRIQPVEGFVAEDIIRPRAKAKDHRKLLFHALGEGRDLSSEIQAEGIHQLIKPGPVKGRINIFIEPHHFLRRRVGKEMLVVGNIKESGFYLGILKYVLPIDLDRALVRLHHTAGHS